MNTSLNMEMKSCSPQVETWARREKKVFGEISEQEKNGGKLYFLSDVTESRLPIGRSPPRGHAHSALRRKNLARKFFDSNSLSSPC
jgi:hypothetical protein